jgi:hypothetical protein
MGKTEVFFYILSTHSREVGYFVLVFANSIHTDSSPLGNIFRKLDIEAISPYPQRGDTRALGAYIPQKLLPWEVFPLVFGLLGHVFGVFKKLGVDILVSIHPT